MSATACAPPSRERVRRMKEVFRDIFRACAMEQLPQDSPPTFVTSVWPVVTGEESKLS